MPVRVLDALQNLQRELTPVIDFSHCAGCELPSRRDSIAGRIFDMVHGRIRGADHRMDIQAILREAGDSKAGEDAKVLKPESGRNLVVRSLSISRFARSNARCLD